MSDAKNKQLERILNELPWLVKNKNVAVSEFARAFSINEDQAKKDLIQLTFVGPGQFGGELVDIQFDEYGIKVIDHQGHKSGFTISMVEINLFLISIYGLMERGINNKILKNIERKLRNLDRFGSKQNTRSEDDFQNLIDKSIDANQILLLDYVDSLMKVTRDRKIVVKNTTIIQGEQYITAIDLKDRNAKTFKSERILKLVGTNSQHNMDIEKNDKLKDMFSVVFFTPKWRSHTLIKETINFHVKDSLCFVEIKVYDYRWFVDLYLKLEGDVELECSIEFKKLINTEIDLRASNLT